MVSYGRRSRLISFLLCLLASTLSIAASSGAQAVQDSLSQPRISKAIDESRLATLQGNTHRLAQAKFDRGVAPASMPASRLLLVLMRSQQQEAYLQTYLNAVQDANSPDYHQFLTPEEFGKKFGVADSDLQAVQTWLKGHGFTVNRVSKSRMTVEFSGTAGQVKSAFHTELHSYVANGVQFWANNADPQIPSALAPVVAGVASLNSLKPKAQIVRGPSGFYNAATHSITPAYTNGNTSSGYYIFLGPADAATIYDTPTALNPNVAGTAYDGTGVTIGILGDSNIDTTQNDNYRSTFGLPAKATTVVIDGNDPGENDDAVEAYLDTEAAAGIAPNANVILYTSAGSDLNPGLNLAIMRALDDNQADILNLSFLGCEVDQGTAGNLYILDIWEQAAAQGMAVTVASGDSGSAGCDNQNAETMANLGLAVNGLASTPYNIAVGGTDYDALYSNFPSSFTSYVDISNTLPNHRSALKYIPEKPWNDSTIVNSTLASNEPLSVDTGNTNSDNIVGAGGGISSLYPVPTWQNGFATGSGRNLPDVSLLSGNGFYGALWGICTDLDPNGPDCTAGATGNSFNLTGVGGTSASAPAFAGMLALIEQKAGSRLGQADPVIYNLAKSKYATVFHDITTGNNSVNCVAGSTDCSTDTAGYPFMTGYNAGTGYDLASGLGSVDASNLLSDWASAGLVASTSSLKLNGGTVALNITHGQSVSVATAVSGSSGTPAGVVGLVDSLSPASEPNNEAIAYYTLASGDAAATTNSLPGGSYQVSAHYSGSSVYAQSDSNAISVTVAPEGSTTVITGVTAYDPATGNESATPYYGFNYLIDAQPYGNSSSAANPDGFATGSITIKSGSTTVGTAALGSDGVAELVTSTIPGGTTSLVATYPGDASFNASTSSPYSLAIVPAVTNLSASSSTSITGAPNSVTITAYLTADSLGVAPTGTVTFQDNSKNLGSVPIVGSAAVGTAQAGGTATFATPTLVAGSHSITPVYSGDANYGGSTATAIPVTINSIGVTLTVVPPTTLSPINQPINVTVELLPYVSDGLPAPTGTVTLSFNSQTLPTVNVVNNSATFTIPANTLSVGSTVVTANYSGDQYYGATSATGNVNTKNVGTIVPTVTVSAPIGTVNYPVTVTVNVAGVQGSPAPTGVVYLSNSFNYESQATLANGPVSFTITANLEQGANTLTATYVGDTVYDNAIGTATVTLIATPGITITPYNPTTVVDQALALTVSVGGPQGIPPPTGTITLSGGGYTSPATQLTTGSASFTIPANSLALGTFNLQASYSGDANYLAANVTDIVTVTPIPVPGLTIAGNAITVAPGATTGNTSTITITPSGGFTGAVTLSCTITPIAASDPATCSVPTSVTITDTTAQTVTLTATTTAASSALNRPPQLFWPAAGGGTLALVLLFGIPGKRRKWRTMLGMFALLVAITSVVLACGGGSSGGSGGGGGGGGGGGNPGTSAGNYTINVAAVSGSVTANAAVTLTVQ
jgi:subtilase family serine protease